MTRAGDIDIGWVASKRAARIGWADIARMAGCAEADLRRHFDPGATGADWTRRPANPRETVRQALLRQGFTADEALILARLWLANGARCTSRDLSSGIAGGELARELCAEAKRRAWAKGIGFEQGPGGYALSPAGLLKISELAGLKGRP